MDDVLAKVLWIKRFMTEQQWEIKQVVIYRDSLSSMRLEENGKGSSGKRTRQFDIKYFYVTDLIARKEFVIEYCPTEVMMADYMTKPITGKKFHKFKKFIMNS